MDYTARPSRPFCLLSTVRSPAKHNHQEPVHVDTALCPELQSWPDRRDETVLAQARKLLTKAQQPVDEALAGEDYLIGEFSGADIMLGHACFMSNRLGAVDDDMTNLKAYVERVAARPAFQKGLISKAQRVQ